MIAITLDDGRVWVPVLASSVDELSTAALRTRALLPTPVAHAIVDLAARRGPPLILDFDGIDVPEARSFCGLRSHPPARDVWIIRASELSRRRIVEDSGPTAWRAGTGTDRDSLHFPSPVSPRSSTSPRPDPEAFIRWYTRQQLARCLGRRESTPRPLPASYVVASRYLNAKALFRQPAALRVLTVALALAIDRHAFPSFDLVLATSFTGALVAANVAHLLVTPLHCYVTLGPRFLMKTSLAVDALAGRRALLIADMICMGTEARIAQAVLSGLSGTLVGAAALAQYAPVPGLPTTTLLSRADLEAIGYRLTLPTEVHP